MFKKIVSLLLALLVPTLSFARDYTGDPRCQLAYLFNEGSGSTVADSTGNGNTCSLTSITWSSSTVPSFNNYGKANNSGQWTTTSSAILGGTSNNLLMYNAPLTITLWMYPTTLPSTNDRLVGKEASGTSYLRLQADDASNGGTDLEFDVKGSTDVDRDTSQGCFTDNAWNFVTVTWDGSTTATNVHIYVNNAECSYNFTTNGATLTSNSGQTIGIGTRGGDTSKTFVGYIAQVGVFNAVLSAAEITDIYCNGLTGNGSFFVSNYYKHWKRFDHNEGFIA